MCWINTRSLHVQVHLHVHSYKHISSQTHIQTSFFDLMSMEMSQSHRCRGWSVILWQAVFPDWLVSDCWLLQREVCTKNLPVIALVTNCLLWSPVVWMEDTDLSLDNWPPWNLKKCDRNWKWRTFASKVKAVPSTQTNMFQKVELLLWRVVVCHLCKLEATTTRFLATKKYKYRILNINVKFPKSFYRHFHTYACSDLWKHKLCYVRDLPG